jgi:hypothetical protein
MARIVSKNSSPRSKTPPAVRWILGVGYASVVIALFFDHQSTLSVNLPTLIGVWAALGVPATLLILRNFKRDYPKRWVAPCIVGTLAIDALIGGAVYMCVQTIAQHASGRQVSVAATVNSIEHVSERRRTCITRATFRSREGDIETCVNPSWGDRLMSARVRVGDAVTLVIVENWFGTAVVRIDQVEP